MRDRNRRIYNYLRRRPCVIGPPQLCAFNVYVGTRANYTGGAKHLAKAIAIADRYAGELGFLAPVFVVERATNQERYCTNVK